MVVVMVAGSCRVKLPKVSLPEECVKGGAGVSWLLVEESEELSS